MLALHFGQCRHMHIQKYTNKGAIISLMKENGNVLSISKSEFIRMVGKKANITQECVESVLEGMEDTLIALFKDVDQYDKIKVRISKNIQMGAKTRKATRRRIPNTGEMIDVPAKCEPYCKFLSTFLSTVRKK